MGHMVPGAIRWANPAGTAPRAIAWHGKTARMACSKRASAAALIAAYRKLPLSDAAMPQSARLSQLCNSTLSDKMSHVNSRKF